MPLTGRHQGGRKEPCEPKKTGLRSCPRPNRRKRVSRPARPRLSKWLFSYLPGAFPASQAVQMALSNLPVPPRLSNWSFPASQVASQAVQLVVSCFPGASQAVQMILACLPGASLRDESCGASWAVQMVFRWPLAVSRASKIKSSLSRLLESVGLALADYWGHLVLPWQITGVIQSPSWRRRAESFSKGSRSTDSSSRARPSWLGHRARHPISDGRQILSKFLYNFNGEQPSSRQILG